MRKLSLLYRLVFLIRMPSPRNWLLQLLVLSFLWILWVAAHSDMVGYAARLDQTPSSITPSATFQELTPTPSPEPIPEIATPVPNNQEIPTTSPSSTQHLLFPLIFRQSPTTHMASGVIRICNYNPVVILDNNPAGVDSQIVSDDLRFIQDLDVQLDIDHGYIGDLSVSLAHQETGKNSLLINRPIDPMTGKKCKLSDIKGILDDEITASVQDQCAVSPAAISGIYVPNLPLNFFRNENVTGTWTLNVADNNPGYIGNLKSWCLIAKLGEVIPPTPTPQPPQLPPQAFVSGVIGYDQQMPLDCESRVAVDYAQFFGVHIGEFNFFYNLPKSDNPDAGFVGNVYGAWGQIPPNPYGVHAEPVAALLRAYGVAAYAHRPLSWDGLRSEIAAGKPVFVWVIDHASYNEIPVYYTSGDGHMSIVAHYEHVVMVKGYNEYNVTIQDGSSTYTRSIHQFLSSWSALDNMAITTQP